MDRDRVIRACYRLMRDSEVADFLFEELIQDTKDAWASSDMNEPSQREYLYRQVQALYDLQSKLTNLAMEHEDG